MNIKEHWEIRNAKTEECLAKYTIKENAETCINNTYFKSLGIELKIVHVEH